MELKLIDNEQVLCKELISRIKTCVFVKNMSVEEWRGKRKNSIGGSDAGAIIGMNKWASPLTVYLDKKGITKFEGNEATRRGTWLEAPIREKCREELGIIIEEVPYMFYSNDYDFMSANIDGLVYVEEAKTIAGVEINGLGGHEIKTSERGDGFSDNEVPDSYYAQVQHYMKVLDLPYFILSAYIINKNEIKHYVIKKDDAFIKELVEKEKDFWENYITKEVMPAPSGCDADGSAINVLLEGSAETLVLDEEAERLCAEYSLINKEIKDKEYRKAEIANTIKLKIIERQDSKDEEKAHAVAGEYKISYTKFLRKSVDTEKLKKEGLYDQYAKISESSTLRITEPKMK